MHQLGCIHINRALSSPKCAKMIFHDKHQRATLCCRIQCGLAYRICFKRTHLLGACAECLHIMWAYCVPLWPMPHEQFDFLWKYDAYIDACCVRARLITGTDRCDSHIHGAMARALMKLNRSWKRRGKYPFLCFVSKVAEPRIGTTVGIRVRAGGPPWHSDTKMSRVVRNEGFK